MAASPCHFQTFGFVTFHFCCAYIAHDMKPRWNLPFLLFIISTYEVVCDGTWGNICTWDDISFWNSFLCGSSIPYLQDDVSCCERMCFVSILCVCLLVLKERNVLIDALFILTEAKMKPMCKLWKAGESLFADTRGVPGDLCIKLTLAFFLSSFPRGSSLYFMKTGGRPWWLRASLYSVS